MITLKVLGAGPVKRGVTLVAADFEKRTGHKIVVEFAGAPGVKDRILVGEAVDIAVVPRGAMNEFGEFVRALASDAGRKLLASTGID